MSIAKVVNNRYIVNSLYQWDQNQTLSIYGLSLPKAPEIHFSNNTMKDAVIVQTTVDAAGVVTAKIPQIFLETSGNIDIYVCIREDESFRCLHKLVVPVKAKPKPSDYVYTETEILSYRTLDERLTRLEESGIGDFDYDEMITDVLNALPTWTGGNY